MQYGVAFSFFFFLFFVVFNDKYMVDKESREISEGLGGVSGHFTRLSSLIRLGNVPPLGLRPFLSRNKSDQCVSQSLHPRCKDIKH